MTVPPTIAAVLSRLLRLRKREVELGTSLLVLPFRLTAQVVLLAIFTVWLDSVLQDEYQRLPRWLRMSADDAKTILATLAGGSITVVALVVSLMMVVLSMVAGNFGPRIILNFERRRTTQLAIGSFVAVFVYSLVSLATVLSGGTDTFAPVISTWTAVVMVLMATGLLVVFVQDISSSIQVGNMLLDISTDLDAAIIRQRELARRACAHTKVDIDDTNWSVIGALEPGYVQNLDFDAMIEIGRRNDCIVRLLHRPGGFVHAGRPMAKTSVPLPAADERLLRRAIVRGSHRTMEQDLEYAIAEYVEIALRALSPAVNDPSTAISCLDWIGDSLVALAVEPIGVAALADSSGTMRVVVPPNSLRRVVASAFNEIRQYSDTSPAVSIRMITTIETVAPSIRDTDALDEMRSQLEAVATAAVAAAKAQRDRDDIDRAYQRADATLEALRPTDGEASGIAP